MVNVSDLFINIDEFLSESAARKQTESDICGQHPVCFQLGLVIKSIEIFFIENA